MDIMEAAVGFVLTATLGCLGWFVKLTLAAKKESEENTLRLDDLEKDVQKVLGMAERMASIETTLKTLDKIPERVAVLGEEVRGGFNRANDGFVNIEKLMNRMEAQLVRLQGDNNRTG